MRTVIVWGMFSINGIIDDHWVRTCPLLLRNSCRSSSKVVIILSYFNQKRNVFTTIVQVPTIIFNENLFGESCIISCIQMDSWIDFNDTPQGWNSPKHIKGTSYISNKRTLHIFLSKYCFMFLHPSVFHYILLKFTVRYVYIVGSTADMSSQFLSILPWTVNKEKICNVPCIRFSTSHYTPHSNPNEEWCSSSVIFVGHST